MAEALAAAGADRLVVDPHTAALEGMCGMPVEMLTAGRSSLPHSPRTCLPEETVVVSPDLGAVKLAERYSALPQRPVALARRT